MNFLKYTMVTLLLGMSFLHVFGNSCAELNDDISADVLVYGYVLDAQSQLPLENASIQITRNGSEFNTTSDASGFFQSMVDSTGLYTINISKTSYYSLRVDEIVTQSESDTFLFALEPDFSFYVDITIITCEGESIKIGENDYKLTGIYVETLISSGGCDSIVTLDLTVLEGPDTTSIDTVICPGDTVFVGDEAFDTSGIHVVRYKGEGLNGCDSLVILNLRVTETFIDTVICYGDTVVIDSFTFFEKGIYTLEYTASNGCDSIVTIDLNYYLAFQDIQDTSICGRFTSIQLCADGISTEALNYSEGFETGDSSEGVETGTWANITDFIDDTYWKRDAGGTPTGNTGPSSGANGSTWYLYTEASLGSNGVPGDSSVLQSQVFDLSYTSYQFDFYYHMYGSDIETLAVKASTDGILWTSIWSKSGDQGNMWKRATVDLSDYSQNAPGSSNVQFRFIAYWNGAYGDIAIDDISLEYDILSYEWSTGDTSQCIIIDSSDITIGTPSNFSYTIMDELTGCRIVDSFKVTNPVYLIIIDTVICEGDVTTYFGIFNKTGIYSDTLQSSLGCDSITVLNLTVGPEPSNIPDTVFCDTSFQYEINPFNSDIYEEGFESGLGTWIQGINGDDDDFDWIRGANGTPTSNTGPQSGANGSDWYVYVEAHNGMPGDTCILKSQTFDLSHAYYELEFYYHMYSKFADSGLDGIGSLAVDVSIDGVDWTQIWVISGNQGNSWMKATIDVSNFSGLNPGSSNVKFRLLATRGSNVYGDIAIDDITLRYKYDYHWSTGDTLPFITIDHNDILNGSSQTYYITATNQITGCSASDTFNITIAAPSTTTIDTTLCGEDTITVGSNVYSAPGTYVDTLVSSYGCDSIVILNLTGESYLSLKVFLDGPYSALDSMMSTDLNTLGLLPGQKPLIGSNNTAIGQPYNVSPWDYGGTEGDDYGDTTISSGLNSYPVTVTDWVLVSVRRGTILSGPGDTWTEIWKCAGLLHKDGVVEFPEGCPCLDINSDSTYHIVVEHRNHLAVMTPPVQSNSNLLEYDFTELDSWKSNLTGSSQNVSQKLLGGNYVMYAANPDQISGRTDVNSVDNSVWLTEVSTLFTYLSGDYDLNADVNSVDRSFYLLNVSLFNLIPF